MPCRSDYMDPSGADLESSEVCKHLVYIYSEIGKAVPAWVQKAASDYYGNVARLDEATKMLCETCRSLTKEEEEKIIYNARSQNARELAGWWERHQKWDKKRVREEEAAKKKKKLKREAMKKLSGEELAALDLLKEDEPRVWWRKSRRT